jgi:predicted nucleic acid-binding OB-fold protein
MVPESPMSLQTQKNLIAFINNKFAQIQNDSKRLGKRIDRLEALKDLQRKERDDEELFQVRKRKYIRLCSDTRDSGVYDDDASAALALVRFQKGC